MDMSELVLPGHPSNIKQPGHKLTSSVNTSKVNAVHFWRAGAIQLMIAA